jgi:hypothetical protein
VRIQWGIAAVSKSGPWEAWQLRMLGVEKRSVGDQMPVAVARAGSSLASNKS